MEFTTKYAGLVARVEHGIDQELPPADAAPSRLHQAMRYSMQSRRQTPAARPGGGRRGAG